MILAGHALRCAAEDGVTLFEHVRDRRENRLDVAQVRDSGRVLSRSGQGVGDGGPGEEHLVGRAEQLTAEPVTSRRRDRCPWLHTSILP